MKSLRVTGLMLRIPKLCLNYFHDCFYFTSYLKSALEGHQCKLESEPKFHEKRLRNDSALKNLFISVKICSCQLILAQVSATIIILQTINLFKLPLFEARGSQKMLYYTGPVGVSDLNN